METHHSVFIPRLNFKLDNLELLSKANKDKLKTRLRRQLFNEQYCKDNSCVVISYLDKDKYQINIPTSYMNKDWVLVLINNNIGHIYHFIRTRYNFNPKRIINKNNKQYYQIIISRDLKSNDMDNFDFKLDQDITLFFYNEREYVHY